MRWLIVTLAILLTFAHLHALPSYPVDEVVIAVNTTTGMELSFFQYKSGYAYGNNYGLEKKAVVELPYWANFFTGDVDGDSIDELIKVVREAQGSKLEIYRYDRDENKLLRLDVARHGSEAGRWLAGDVNGDGVDELILIQPKVAWTEIYLYTYDPEYSRGITEKLRQLDMLKYRESLENWLAGDINGDGIDELIAIQALPYETRLTIFLYDTSYIRDLTEKLNKIGEAKYTQPFAALLAGDVDGDGRDELVGVEYAYYETRLRLMRYEPGYTYGTTQGLRTQDVLRHYKIEPMIFLGNVDSALKVLSRHPTSEKLTVKPGEEVRFGVEAEHTDELKVSYLWRFNGIDVSRDSEFTYTAKLGSGVVECIVSAPFSEVVVSWRVDVTQQPQKQEVREEEERKNTPPEVEIVSPANGAKASGEVEVRWVAQDADGDPLTVRIELISTKGVTTLYQGSEAEGSYRLDVSSFEAGSYMLRAEVSDGKSTASDEVTFDVYREEVEKGLLVVSSIPTGAEVYIDGERVATTDAELYLPPRRYRVRLEKAGYMPYETEVEVFSGRSTSVEAKLIKRIFGLSPAIFFFVVLIAMSVAAFLIYKIAKALKQRMRLPREELEESITRR
jgi:hypothetical protein